jgi:hypothetical protein
MAIKGPIKVDSGELFPHGLGVVGAVAQLDDFDASTRENRVQARDKDTGLPLWSVDVMDFDPDARERVFKVKVASAVQPVPPDPIAGAPVRPVVLEGLTVTPYIKDGPRRGSRTRCGRPAWRQRSASRIGRPDRVRASGRVGSGAGVALVGGGVPVPRRPGRGRNWRGVAAVRGHTRRRRRPPRGVGKSRSGRPERPGRAAGRRR